MMLASIADTLASNPVLLLFVVAALGSASVYPVAMIAKIVIAQVLAVLTL